MFSILCVFSESDVEELLGHIRKILLEEEEEEDEENEANSSSGSQK